MWLLIPILFYTIIFMAVRHVYSYWRRKGFPHEKSALTLSFLKRVYKREFYQADAIAEAYCAGKERFVGIYFLFHPTLLIRDLSLARAILENPYGHFNDCKWDYVRGYRKFNLMEKISPIFASGRLEAMFRNIEKVGDNLLNHLYKSSAAAAAASVSVPEPSLATASATAGVMVDMQQLLRIYSVNVIANLIYGCEIDLLKQTDSVFQQYLNYSIRQSAVNSYTFNRIPKKSSLTYRLRDVIRENVERREEGGLIRKDILQILVKFRNGNDIEQKEKLNWHIENLFEREHMLSIKKLAQIAEHLLENGMTTIASTAVFTLYEILQQAELKEKIIDELRSQLNSQQQQGNKPSQLTYEGLRQLKLMDLCIQETVRKYPSVAVIERVCRRDFQMPDSKHILSEGKSFIIPLLAIQRDEKYFEDPLSYKPQRFLHDSNGNKSERLISFGLGAKACIAQHFVKLVVKSVLVKLFLNFQMDSVPVENFDICYNNTPFICSKEGFKVKLKTMKIKTNF